MARLIIRDDSGDKTVDLRDGIVTFGRAPENKVVVADKECSRHQFHIERVDAGYKVVDLESRNGTRVNGKHVNQHLLQQGDRINIGKCTIVFEDPDYRAPAGGQAPVPGAAAAAPAPPSEAKVERRSGHTTSLERLRGEIDGRRRSRTSVQLTGAIAAVFFLTVIVLIVVGAVTGEPSGTREAREKYDRAAKAEPVNPREALALFESIPPAAGEIYKKAQERAAAIRQRLVVVPTNVDPAEQAAFDALYDLQQNYPHKVEEIVRLCEDFRGRYSRSQYLGKVDEYLRAARESRGAVRRRDLDDAIKDVDAALATNDFRKAIAVVNKAYEKHKLDIDLKQPIEKQYARVVEAGRRCFQEQDAVAEKLKSEGKIAEARQVYSDVLSVLGGIEEFADQARIARAKLDAIK